MQYLRETGREIAEARRTDVPRYGIGADGETRPALVALVAWCGIGAVIWAAAIQVARYLFR